MKNITKMIAIPVWILCHLLIFSYSDHSKKEKVLFQAVHYALREAFRVGTATKFIWIYSSLFEMVVVRGTQVRWRGLHNLSLLLRSLSLPFPPLSLSLSLPPSLPPSLSLPPSIPPSLPPSLPPALPPSLPPSLPPPSSNPSLSPPPSSNPSLSLSIHCLLFTFLRSLTSLMSI